MFDVVDLLFANLENVIENEVYVQRMLYAMSLNTMRINTLCQVDIRNTIPKCAA